MSLESESNVSKFPQKLWEAATYNEDGLIYWSSSGNSIIFRYDFIKKYSSPVGSNPSLFHTKSLSSFVRHLNSYGFRKVKKTERDLHGKPSAAMYLQYSREFFQKGRPDLLSLIERRQRKPLEEGVFNIRMRKNKFNYREKVIKNKLENVDEARKNFTKVLAKTLEAHKNGDKDNFLKKSLTVNGIKNLCKTTLENIVRVSSQPVVLQHSKDTKSWSLVDVSGQTDKFSCLIGDWNAVPITKHDGPLYVSKEVVIEYLEEPYEVLHR